MHGPPPPHTRPARSAHDARPPSRPPLPPPTGDLHGARHGRLPLCDRFRGVRPQRRRVHLSRLVRARRRADRDRLPEAREQPAPDVDHRPVGTQHGRRERGLPGGAGPGHRGDRARLALRQPGAGGRRAGDQRAGAGAGRAVGAALLGQGGAAPRGLDGQDARQLRPVQAAARRRGGDLLHARALRHGRRRHHGPPAPLAVDLQRVQGRQEPRHLRRRPQRAAPLLLPRLGLHLPQDVPHGARPPPAGDTPRLSRPANGVDSAKPWPERPPGWRRAACAPAAGPARRA